MRSMFFAVFLLVFAGWLGAQALSADQGEKVRAKLAAVRVWGTAPEVVAGILASPPAWEAAMNQDQWKGLSILSPEVKELAKNPVAAWLRTQKDATVSEIFVSRADGTKVAFLAKPTSWSHRGKPKHEVPMTGKTWIGEIETDESTGLKQVQVAFPVLDGTRVIGSVVVGLQLSKL